MYLTLKAPIAMAIITPIVVERDLIWALTPIWVLNVWLISISNSPERMPGDWTTKKLKNSAISIILWFIDLSPIFSLSDNNNINCS